MLDYQVYFWGVQAADPIISLKMISKLTELASSSTQSYINTGLDTESENLCHTSRCTRYCWACDRITRTIRSTTVYRQTSVIKAAKKERVKEWIESEAKEYIFLLLMIFNASMALCFCTNISIAIVTHCTPLRQTSLLPGVFFPFLVDVPKK